MDLNIRDFDEELGQALKVEAARAGKTLKELVTDKLSSGIVLQGAGTGRQTTQVGSGPSGSRRADVTAEAPRATVGSSPTPATKLAGHDTKSCRVYRCGQCKGLGVKDKGRGLE